MDQNPTATVYCNDMDTRWDISNSAEHENATESDPSLMEQTGKTFDNFNIMNQHSTQCDDVDLMDSQEDQISLKDNNLLKSDDQSKCSINDEQTFQNHVVTNSIDVLGLNALKSGSKIGQSEECELVDIDVVNSRKQDIYTHQSNGNVMNGDVVGREGKIKNQVILNHSDVLPEHEEHENGQPEDDTIKHKLEESRIIEEQYLKAIEEGKVKNLVDFFSGNGDVDLNISFGNYSPMRRTGTSDCSDDQTKLTNNNGQHEISFENQESENDLDILEGNSLNSYSTTDQSEDEVSLEDQPEIQEAHTHLISDNVMNGDLVQNGVDSKNQLSIDHHDVMSDNEETVQTELDESQAFEEQFMKAIEDGNVTAIMDFLSKKDELDLNINYVNENGDTPMRLAVTSGYSVMVEHLLSHGACLNDGLLRAVDVGFEETVMKILEYIDKIPSAETRLELMNCRSQGDYLHPDVTPMVLAAQKNDFTLVKLFRDRGCSITEIGSKHNGDSTKSLATDELQKSLGSLETYKGLASEAYLSQVNDDPVETAFKLSKKLRQLSQIDVECRTTYLKLADNTDVIGTEIISYARNTEEIMTVLNYQESNQETHGKIAPLPKISRAIEYEQKQFVAHQNCQQAILSKFYGGVTFFRDMNTMDRLLAVMCMIIGFPLLSLMILYVPIKRVQVYISCPYAKFIMKFASDLFFVVILTADIVINNTLSPDRLSIRTPTKIFLLLWILGIAWREIKCIYKQKTDILVQFSHWRDILLVVFFLTGVLLDTISYNQHQDASTKVAVSKRDASYLAIDITFLNANRNLLWGDDNNQTTSAKISHARHRIPRNTLKWDRKAEPGARDPSSAFNSDSQDADFLGFDWSHPILIANTLFGMASVIAFLRMLPYVVVSDVIGPLQISLGSMVTQTAHFFLVVALVLFSFAMGLTYIYSYYDETEALRCDESVESCERGYFRNLFFALIFLYWSLLGMEDHGVLKLNSQAQVMEAAGLLLYAMFYILLIMVLLNALIAVMSEAYNNVEENADVEWKFHSTVMWMSILLDDEAVPPPFNMLPSYPSCRNFISKCLNFRWKRRNGSCSSELKGKPAFLPCRRSSISDTGQYKRVMNLLVERYVMAKTADEISVEGGVGFNDILGLRNDLLSLKADLYQKLVKTKDHIDQTTLEGTVTRRTSVTAKNVLYTAETVHENVETNLVQTVLKLEAEVNEYKAKLETQQKQRVMEDTEVRELLRQSSMEEKRLRELLSQGTLDEAGMRGLISQLSIKETKLKELLSQKAIEETRLNEILSQKTMEETKLKELLSQKTMEEAGLKELLGQKTIEEANQRELLSQKTMDEARLKELLSQKTMEVARVRELSQKTIEEAKQSKVLSKASQCTPDITVRPMITKPETVDQSTQNGFESRDHCTQTERKRFAKTSLKESAKSTKYVEPSSVSSTPTHQSSDEDDWRDWDIISVKSDQSEQSTDSTTEFGENQIGTTAKNWVEGALAVNTESNPEDTLQVVETISPEFAASNGKCLDDNASTKTQKLPTLFQKLLNSGSFTGSSAGTYDASRSLASSTLKQIEQSEDNQT